MSCENLKNTIKPTRSTCGGQRGGTMNIAERPLWSALRPLYLSSWLLGLLPFAWRDEGGLPRTHATRGSLAYALTSLGLSLAARAAVSYFYFKDRILESGMAAAPTVLHSAATVMALVVSTVTLLFRRKMAAISVNQVIALEFTPMRASQYTIVLGRAIRLQLAGIIAVQGATAALQLLRDEGPPNAWAVVAVDELKVMLVAAQFTALVSMLRLYLCRANQMLRVAVTAPSARTQVSSPESADAATAVQRVTYLARFQEQIADLGDQINMVYGLPLLVFSACVFLALTAGLYVIISCALGKAHCEPLRLRATNGLWCFSQAIVLALVTAAANSCTKEAKESLIIVNKIIGDVQDSELKSELDVLSLQLMHRQVRFSACGFFPIDFSLLYTIIGAVTTYLVILLQFQISFDNKIPTESNVTTACSVTYSLENTTNIYQNINESIENTSFLS